MPKTKNDQQVRNLASKAVSSRHARRTLNLELREQQEFINGGQSYESVASKVTALMKDAGIVFLKDDACNFITIDPQGLPKIVSHKGELPLNYYDESKRGGVELQMRKLVWNPGALNEDLTYPWAGRNRSAKAVKSFLESFQVPRFARGLKSKAISSLSAPNTTGMLVNGTPNKDLEQLLNEVKPFQELIEVCGKAYNILELRDLATTEIADELIRAVKAGIEAGEIDTDLIEVTADGIRFKPWELRHWVAQMAKAIKQSTPGYPFNGFGWTDDIEGVKAFEHVFKLGERFIADEEEDAITAFKFFQQSRRTGDGLGLDETGEQGRQRLVAAAEAIEKLIGHMVAYIFKWFLKSFSKLSGQHGVQACSETLKEIAQLAKEMGEELIFLFFDVSRWDSGQSDQAMKTGFFAVLNKALDHNCQFTSLVERRYIVGYFNKILVTALGQIRLPFLPSGCGITTASAFMNHMVIWWIIRYIHTDIFGHDFVRDIGFQGDDTVVVCTDYTAQIEEIIREVYIAHNLLIKGDLEKSRLSDEHPYVEYLGECINLLSAKGVDTNIRFPKWSLFWAEDIRAQSGYGLIDRHLMDELTNNVAHPSPTEILFYSLTCKLDRFANLPFFDLLVGQLRSWSAKDFPLLSWLGERTILRESPTIKVLKQLEEDEGIEWPEITQRVMDRREDTWLTGDEILGAMIVCGLAAEHSMEARGILQSLVKKARLTGPSWKRAQLLLKTEIPDAAELSYPEMGLKLAHIFQTRENMLMEQDTSEVREQREVLEAVLEEHAVEEGVPTPPFEMKSPTVAKALVALNDKDPYRLRYLLAKVVMASVLDGSYDKMELSEQQKIDDFCQLMFGCSPVEAAGDYPALDHLGSPWQEEVRTSA